MEAKLKRRKNARAALVRAALWACVLFTAGVFLLLVAYVLVRGVPHLRLSMFSPTYTTENLSMLPAILNTLTMTGVTLLIAVPLGVGAAIYLTEYAKPGNRLVPPIRLTTETLAGIPSIVYGLFGYLVFVKALHLRLSLLSGALTLAIMILPSIISVSETALRAVPEDYEQASLALGATHLETVFRVTVPAARSGVATAIVLGVGRAIGEAMAIIMVAGNVANMPGLFQSVRFLTTAIASEMSYASVGSLQRNALFSIGLVLFLFIMLINAALNFFLKRRKEH